MTHQRKTIRHQAISILTAGVPLVAGRVFRSRAYPVQTAEMPGICVYTREENSDDQTLRGTLDRFLDLSIDIYDRNSETPDDDLDDIAEEVEAAMDADATLGGTANSNSLTSTSIGFDGEGEKANGLARLTYRVRYRTKKP